jgi:hypothetical protein
MNSTFVLLYAAAAILGIAMMIAPFVSRFRDASLWLRFGMFVNGPLAIAWSALGFYLHIHEADGKTTLPWSKFWHLELTQANIAGLAVGVLICVLLSPESRRLNRRRPSV